MPKNEHHKLPAAPALPEGAAASYHLKFLLTLVLAVFTAISALYLWKIKFFPSRHWYQRLPEFTKYMAGFAGGTGTLITIVSAIAVLIQSMWTGTPPKKPKDVIHL